MNYSNLLIYLDSYTSNDRSCWPGLLNLEWGLNFLSEKIAKLSAQVKHCCILFKHYVRPRDLVNLTIAAYKSYCKCCIFSWICPLLFHSYQYFKISYSKGGLKLGSTVGFLHCPKKTFTSCTWHWQTVNSQFFCIYRFNSFSGSTRSF